MTTQIPFLQIDVDIGSSSVARGVIGLVLGYVTSIVVDLAILIEVCPYLMVTLSKAVFFLCHQLIVFHLLCV